MKTWLKLAVALTVSTGLVTGCSKDDDEDEDVWESMIPETDKEPTTAGVQGFVFRPALAPPSAENVQQLRVPAGFAVNKFAEGLGKPRILAVSSAGHVYYSDREAGTVTLLQDTNADGVSDRKQVVANIRQAHGLTIHNGNLYIVAVRELYVAGINMDGTLQTPRQLLNNLPDGGQHPNRTIAFGPDGKLYITVGSTCNSCPEPNKENATILIADADGTNRRIFAKGLRNTIGFGWHPTTNELWGMDHGIDWLGDDEQKEELNKITAGANYGWPYIYGEGKYNPSDRPKGDTTYAQYLKLTTLPTLTYQAHAAPMAMAFYTATQFPQEYRNDAFVAMRGSWNRSTPSGYKVVRVHFENGQPTRFDDFLTGFLVNNNRSQFARLVGVAVNRDGALLVSDDTNGVIYRVAYR
ncbi:PQQ-dependent sugar dehydrogenase [Hymenobacter weizhouensis]|uniref:PQQ-dependent sugar dehydrogenase n=1 Tax=Hymenobacter sp. YIM 151500-1 TaxID=2987689 RepID=UPI0022279103|nr:PQQ-dependent sugar dehydrogenase [Hymenobacter sp. YIM 151500-1]UYZ61398.1 PQQ-dependent sugar dehydrogenase [Hymenobacter sp. YIM 151500-1]